MTKTELKKKTNEIIKDAVKGMRKNMDKAISSGSMDIKGAVDDYILPRSLLIALLKEEIHQSDCMGSVHEKKIKMESQNIYSMI